MAKRSARRRQTRRRVQRGGDGWGFQGAAFNAAGGVPIESRAGFSHCGMPARPGSLVGGRRSARRSRRAQHGGACGGGCTPGIQYGGGGGTGGYGFALTNELGKVYPLLTVGACPSAAQRGGANMMETRAIDNNFSAGYGYGKESAVEVGGGTAHFLAQLPYGRQCMGGGARSARRGKKSHKRSRHSRH
jgi:hypothetical protein